MTDIYDFRDSVFVTYNDEWILIYKGIYNYIKLKQRSLDNIAFLKLFKKHIPRLWDKCPEDILLEFIFRAVQIAYHELIYIPSKGECVD